MSKTNNTDKSARGPHATLEAARAVQPDEDKLRLFSVSRPDGEPLYVWAGSPWDALHVCMRSCGWKAVALDKLPTREDVAASFAMLPAEDRAALLKQFKGK